MTKTDMQKNQMVEALEKAMGIVSTACKVVGIARQTHYEWMKTDADYKKKCDDLANVVLDFAETELYRKIKDGDTTAIIFFLKTKGKGRGYIERQELHNIQQEPLQIEVIHANQNQ